MRKDTVRRNTKQRQIILEELCKVKTHPNADAIFKMARKRVPNISYGTVYRNLNLLRDECKVLELSFGKYSCRYDGIVSNHYHFFCQKCKNVFDIDEVFVDGLDKKVSKVLDFKVEHHRVEFYGLCDKCRPH